MRGTLVPLRRGRTEVRRRLKSASQKNLSSRSPNRGQTARLHTTESTNHNRGIRIAALEERVLNLETRRQ
jgi:hypothetical protein